MDYVANFQLNRNDLNADFQLENTQFDAVFELNPAGASWGSITGDIDNQIDLRDALDAKQDVLTAGDNVQIVNNVISATDTTYTAGTGISIENGVISNTQTSAIWGNIEGTLSNQTDLQNALNAKQDTISDLSTIRQNAQNGNSAYGTIQTYGDIVTYNASYFATSAQGDLADTALQPNDNISELVNDAGYITSASLPTVNNSTITIQKNGTDIESFTLNQSSNETINISVPTDTADLTNGAGFITSSALPTVNDGKLTLQVNSVDIGEFTANQSSTSTVNITVPTDTADLTNGAGFITSASIPTVNNATITIQKNGSNVGTFTLNQANNETLNITVPVYASDIGALPDTTTIKDLTTTAQFDALNSGATVTNIVQITTNQNDIANIRSLIPLQASTLNQLADKNFVNSSIATNTANFIGTFNSVADLEAYSGTLTNNDYAFVATTDSAGNTLYDRYKYNANTQQWIFEYELNNSSFTAQQWASINSGITSGDVSLISTALQPNDNVSSLVNDAGYITSADLPTNYVTTDTAQTISGDKTFNGAFSANSTYTIAIETSDELHIAETTNGNHIHIANDHISIVTQDCDIQLNSSNNQGIVDVNATDFNFNHNQIATVNDIPTDTNDLTNGAGFITGITSTDVTNALGYTPYSDANPNGYITGITGADVTNALGFTPYDASNPNGYTSNIGTVTSVNNVSPVSGNVTISIPTDTNDLTNGAGYITSSALTDYVTTNTAQTISARKTFTGEKAIYFKQVATTNKLGFTLYNPSNTELGAFEYRPNTINGNALLNVNTSYSNSCYVGFRYWGTAVNIIAPKVATAGDYYIPTHITDGNTTVTANNAGVLNISSLLPTIPTIDQVYDDTSANAQSGVAIAGAGFLTSSDLKTVNNTSIVGTGDIDTSEVFVAEYGITTYSDIKTAYNSGKLVTMQHSRQYVLQGEIAGSHELVFFSCGVIDGYKRIYIITVDNADVWTSHNYDVLDDDLSNISSTGQKVLDGAFVESPLQIANGVTYPTGTSTNYDLSTYLPNDSYNYYVLLSGSATTGTTSGNPCNLNLQSDLTSNTYIPTCGTRTRANANTYAIGTIDIPIGTGRRLTVVAQSNLVGQYGITLIGYRRIGTNS